MIEIDYKELLKKYIQHVIDQEGTDFLGFTLTEDGYLTFTKDEVTALRELSPFGEP